MVESAAPVPGRVFINYRREETAYPAGWLYDRLANRYGGQVFKEGDFLSIKSDEFGITYEGRFRKEAKEINGTFTQGPFELPLVMRRAQ